MKKRVQITIAVCLVAFLAFAVAFEEVSKPAAQVPVVQVEPVVKIYTVDELLAEANRLRAEKGVAPLVLDERLNQSAQWKADDMKEFKYFGHVRDGYHGFSKIDEFVPECSLVGENLDGADLDESPFENNGWVTSKPHYEAEINPRYDTTGFASVRVGIYIYYVQHFCDLR